MTKQEIIAKVNEIWEESEYETFGIRVQEEAFELGKIDHVSKVWIDGEETDEELDGFCAVKPAMYQPGYYNGKHIAILGCNNCTTGEDAGEIIMEDAEVLYIIA